MLIPDIITDIKFNETSNNGRKTATPSNFFSCVFVIGEDKHDCRLLLETIGSISPGEFKKNVPIKFLCPELVLPKLNIGKKFYLWEMKNIADGVVIEVVNKDNKQM